MPLVVIVGIEEDNSTREVRVHELEGEGSCQGGKESPPHHLMWEIVGDLEQEHSENEKGSEIGTN